MTDPAAKGEGLTTNYLCQSWPFQAKTPNATFWALNIWKGDGRNWKNWYKFWKPQAPKKQPSEFTKEWNSFCRGKCRVGKDCQWYKKDNRQRYDAGQWTRENKEWPFTLHWLWRPRGAQWRVWTACLKHLRTVSHYAIILWNTFPRDVIQRRTRRTFSSWRKYRW